MLLLCINGRKNKEESAPKMTEQDGPFETSPDKEPNSANPELVSTSTLILRILPGEQDPETGEVFAETLYSDSLSASDAEEAEEEVVTALIGYDPRQFPEDIRDEILAGKPFEVTSIQIQSPDGYFVDSIDSFSLVEK